MKQILSLILVSALVLSATANVEAITQVINGFALGLGYADLNPTLANCSISINNTKTSAQEALIASEISEPEVFEQAVALLGYNFAHTFRVCGKVKLPLKELYESVNAQLKNLTRDDLRNRLFTNLYTFNLKWVQLKTKFVQKDFQAVGVTLAEMFKLFVYNSSEIPRNRRQLGQIANLIKAKIAFDLNATVLGVLGFIEEANTTVAVADYLSLVNDTTTLATQFTTLEDAIEKFDFQTIVSTVTSISVTLVDVGTDATILKKQTTDFIQRDLPLFTDEKKVTKAVESLFLDLPTTLTNIQRIVNSYKKADFRETGHGTGGLYNQLRNGALSA
jgi:hypothetical protein